MFLLKELMVFEFVFVKIPIFLRENLVNYTNLKVDNQLLQSSLLLTGFKEAEELVTYALREVIRHHQQKSLLDLEGQVDWEGDLDQMRLGRHFDDFSG
jgi:Arc/MetJ family transcription regulator